MLPPPETLLSNLTETQKEACRHHEGPLLMLAGPGSGKTRVITHRIAYLLATGVMPRSILALTFTNKAAQEMQDRLANLAPRRNVMVGTFHRFCSRLLRKHASAIGLKENFTIYDSRDSLKIIKQIHQIEDITHFKPETIAKAISREKNRLITWENFLTLPQYNPRQQILAKVYPLYQKHLLHANAVDFDDLLLHTVTLLKSSEDIRQYYDDRFSYIMVDEYQDTNLPQYAIVRALSRDLPNLAVTGDPDQAIYGWRGANLNNILNFEKDFPNVTTIRLVENFRSTKNILHTANQLILYNTKRKEKTLHTENPQGSPVQLHYAENNYKEANRIADYIQAEISQGNRKPNDFAVLYRTNALSRVLETSLQARTIPYQILNSVEFYHRKEIKDVLAYLLLANNTRDNLAFERVVNVPTRGIGKKTLQYLQQYALRKNLTLLEACREANQIENLSKRARTALHKFATVIANIREKLTGFLKEALELTLAESGYWESLNDGSEEDEDRRDNLGELLSAAQDFDDEKGEPGHLDEFLERVALISDTDGLNEESNVVSLMTLHSAKGLEFPVVFIIALEEGILPHSRSLEDPNQYEEERRLLFVGITRAEEELHLSLSDSRSLRGYQEYCIPSSFLMELPRDDLLITSDSSQYDSGSTALMEAPHKTVSRHHEQITENDHSVVPFEEEAPKRHVSPKKLGTTEATDLSNLIKTGSAMLSSQANVSSAPRKHPSDRVSPNQFRLGMRVIHPDHGLGKIIELSGQGAKRRAKVLFATANEKKFILALSPLRPA
ncbi:MAG: UvrD-helicase domain-containing protein [Pirellulaceae bacterium]|nr:UvrD-helicase domain-containing protein [Pirellulaceae bacterium]